MGDESDLPPEKAVCVLRRATAMAGRAHTPGMAASDWPGLALADWDDSKQTLHRYAQIVGKVRMALTPPQNHWWHVTLIPGTVGLQTGPMPVPDGRTVELAFDFV